METELRRFLTTRIGSGLDLSGLIIDESGIVSGIELPKPLRDEIGMVFGLRVPAKGQDMLTSSNDAGNGHNQDDQAVLILDELLETAVKQKASDLHFEQTEDELTVRFRLDGVLRIVRRLDANQRKMFVSRLKVMAGMDITEARRPQDGRIQRTIDGATYDFRVSTMPTHYGEKIVIRVLDKGAIQLDLQQLGIPEQNLDLLFKELSKPNGLILVTGPTGSGKTTTLYAALQRLVSDEVNIVTVEDPIEYNIERVNQSQVNHKIGYDFAQALRHVLRQDPDVILVGEIRDSETLQIAVRASITGHLVLSTLHTNSSIGAIPRLLDLGVEPFLIASSLNLVIAQRLVRRICPDCRKAASSPAVIGNHELNHYEGTGCPACDQTGYKGRVGAFEFLVINENLREAIKKGLSEQEMRKMASENNFQEIRELMINLINKGETTIHEVVRQGYL